MKQGIPEEEVACARSRILPCCFGTPVAGRHLILRSLPCLSQPKRDGQQLLTQVWRRLNLTECDYFGLEFQHPRAYWVRALASLLQTGCGCWRCVWPREPRRTCGSDGSTEPCPRAVVGAVPWEYGVHVAVTRLSSCPP